MATDWDGKEERRSTNPWLDVLNDRLRHIDNRIEHIETASLDPQAVQALKEMAMFWNGSRMMSSIIIGFSALIAAVGVFGGGLVWLILFLRKIL